MSQSELQCIHREGCPKPEVCRQAGHCTSMTQTDLDIQSAVERGGAEPATQPPYVHSPNPTVEGYSLCAITHEDDKPVILAVVGEHVNCPRCRAVIDAALRMIGLKNPTQYTEEETNFERWWAAQSRDSFRQANGDQVPYRADWGLGFKSSMRQAWLARAGLAATAAPPKPSDRITAYAWSGEGMITAVGGENRLWVRHEDFQVVFDSHRWLYAERQRLELKLQQTTTLRNAVSTYVEAVKPVKRQLIDDQNFTDEWDAMVRALAPSSDETPADPNDHGHVDHHTEEYLQSIDAAFFSGDSFHSEAALRRFEYFMGRWRREATSIRELLDETKQGESSK